MDVYDSIVRQKPGPGVCIYSSGSSPVQIVLAGPAEAESDKSEGSRQERFRE